MSKSSALLLLLIFAVPAEGEVETGPFGHTASGEATRLFTLSNTAGMRVAITDYGATIQSIVVPDRNGQLQDVAFGFDDVTGYQSDANGYFGCTVGRYANRIADARFSLGGKVYQLTANDGLNHLHGGAERSFDKVVWAAAPFSTTNGEGVEFSHTSAAGEEGYPGQLVATVRFVLTPDNRIVIEYSAKTDAPTIVNLTNHAYFNLAGAGAATINDHLLTIYAESYTPVGPTLIPTGEIAPVEGTAFDFREPIAIGARVDQLGSGEGAGYDHNFVLREEPTTDGLRHAATLHESTSGRTLDVWTDQPGLQFYGGNFLNGQRGKSGQSYAYRSGLCLETQLFPDSPNRPEWPSPILRPGQTYRHTCVYAFSAK